MRLVVVLLVALVACGSATASPRDVPPPLGDVSFEMDEKPTAGSTFQLRVHVRANHHLDGWVLRAVPTSGLEPDGSMEVPLDLDEGERGDYLFPLRPVEVGLWSVGLEPMSDKAAGTAALTDRWCCVFGWSSLAGGGAALDPRELDDWSGSLRVVATEHPDRVVWETIGDWRSEVPETYLRLNAGDASMAVPAGPATVEVARSSDATQHLQVLAVIGAEFPRPTGHWSVRSVEGPRPAPGHVYCGIWAVAPIGDASGGAEYQGPCGVRSSPGLGGPHFAFLLAVLIGGIGRARRWVSS